ncbi:tubulin epsilon and delta complex protein 1 isoform X2 [Bombina bombina]|uniref:tubulin epsilon and delta complex protein 1 isoform X2 n=1 Tax=Bombina bombina TaxID=8345 RepID=UPI00235AB5CD|nr:tubulin epsilon and delta complex protein 1 isoform X2 [Bombina bombina]
MPRLKKTPEFWKLLYCLLKEIYREKDSSVPSSESEKFEKQMGFVKSVLWNQGYGRSAFYHLPHNSTDGSRELLLAFSWILSKMKVLEKILEMNRVKVGDEIAVCTCPQDLGFKANEDASPLLKVDVRYLQWLSGKLRFSWKILHAAEQEKCALLYKIHSYTQGCHVDPDIKHLSFMETEFVRHPEDYSKLLQLLESESSCLEAYLEWKQLEPVYWQWMESVLESGLEEEKIISAKSTNRDTSLPDDLKKWRDNLNCNIKKIDKDLTQLHNRLQESIPYRKALWNEQIKETEREISEKERSLMMKKIKQDICKRTDELQYRTAKAIEMHGHFRLVFHKDSNSVSSSKFFNSRGIRAADFITKLEKSGAELEAELRILQEECRLQMDEIAEKLEGVICIPPAKNLPPTL